MIGLQNPRPQQVLVCAEINILPIYKLQTLAYSDLTSMNQPITIKWCNLNIWGPKAWVCVGCIIVQFRHGYVYIAVSLQYIA